MDVVREQIEVEVDAAGPATVPLTWSQLWMWRIIGELGTSAHRLNVRRVVPLGEGATVARVLAALRELIGRHEALRTTYHDSGAGPVQTVHGRVRQRVTVCEAPVGEGRTTASKLRDELAATGYGPQDRPLRVAIVVEQSVPRYAALVVHHLACDDWGIETLAAEFRRLSTADDRDASDPVPAWQPRDHVRVEGSAEGDRWAGAARRYWQERVAGIPQSMFGVQYAPRQPRFWNAELVSTRMTKAAGELVRRHRVRLPTLMLAAAQAVLAVVSGNEMVALQLVSANRARPEEQSSVSCLAQPVLATVAVSGGTFAEFVRRSWESSMLAYRHGRSHPDIAAQVVDEVNRRRGTELDLSCYVNFHAMAPQGRGADQAQEASVPAVDGFRWKAKLDYNNVRFYLHVHPRPDNIVLRLHTDTAYVSPPTTERFLWGVERLIVAAAEGSVAIADLAAVIGPEAPERER